MIYLDDRGKIWKVDRLPEGDEMFWGSCFSPETGRVQDFLLRADESGVPLLKWGYSRKYRELPSTDGAVRVRRVRRKGRGYSGGHNTAARLGWSVSYPAPDKDWLLYWDTTDQGAFTGFHPSIEGLMRDD